MFSSPPKSSPFLPLPTEIHLKISTFLAMPHRLHLRHTNHYLFTTIPLLSHPERLEAEANLCYDIEDMFACKYCHRLRPRCKLAGNMTRKKGLLAGERFCIDCNSAERRRCQWNIIALRLRRLSRSDKTVWLILRGSLGPNSTYWSASKALVNLILKAWGFSCGLNFSCGFN